MPPTPVVAGAEASVGGAAAPGTPASQEAIPSQEAQGSWEIFIKNVESDCVDDGEVDTTNADDVTAVAKAFKDSGFEKPRKAEGLQEPAVVGVLSPTQRLMLRRSLEALETARQARAALKRAEQLARPSNCV